MSISPQFLEELRTRVSLPDLVGRRVKLTRRGHDYLGLCPFHKEKTPSFTVSMDKGFYHCFGCGAHGDAVEFLIKQENLTFLEAVEQLAQMAGISVPKDAGRSSPSAAIRGGLRSALDQAAQWFYAQLNTEEGRKAGQYLLNRGLSRDLIRGYRLGYAPDRRYGLKEHLLKQGLSEQDLLDAGLIIRPEDGAPAYDRFRGRVMFPITDIQDRVIGFGGRVLGDGEPKYLNSPETVLFHKGKVLYGLARARQKTRDYGTLIVAEGYMDVLAMVQAGLDAAVAPLGTALTEDQIQLLWRYASEPILCFDGDAAGQRAALRALDRALPLLKPGHSLRFAFMPAGEDPDSLIRKQGRAAFDQLLGAARPLVEVLWQSLHEAAPLDTPERRAGFRQRLLTSIRRIGDASVQAAYRTEIEGRLQHFFQTVPPPRPQNFSKNSTGRPFRHQTGRGRAPSYAWGGGEAARQAPLPAGRRRRQLIVATLLRFPRLIAARLEALSDLAMPDSDLDKLYRDIIDLAACAPDLDATSLNNHLMQQGFATLLADLDHELHRSGRHVSGDEAAAAVEIDHIIGLIREEDLRREAANMAQGLAHDPSDDGVARQRQLAELLEQGESRRRDLDQVIPAPLKKN